MLTGSTGRPCRLSVRIPRTIEFLLAAKCLWPYRPRRETVDVGSRSCPRRQTTGSASSYTSPTGSAESPAIYLVMGNQKNCAAGDRKENVTQGEKMNELVDGIQILFRKRNV